MRHENIKIKQRKQMAKAKSKRYPMPRVKAQVVATPSWFGEFDRFVLREAKKLTILRYKATGIKWHVDHMVPIVSKHVCGLHIGINIQVITEKQNLQKGNRYWPDMHTR